jgi:hypothetical protein
MIEQAGTDALEQLLDVGQRLHRRQVALLLRLRRGGADIGQARQVLEALGDCLDLMCGHRQRLLSRGQA